MGTTPKISSHPPFVAEAANGVGLLLFWPAAFSRLLGIPATLGLPVLLVTAEPSGCPFVPAFRPDFPERSVLQAPVPSPEGYDSSFRSLRAETLCFLKPCDSVAERTFPVFLDLPDIRDLWSFHPYFGSLDAQTRRPDRTGLCFI
jgi:hypothetical protein